MLFKRKKEETPEELRRYVEKRLSEIEKNTAKKLKHLQDLSKKNDRLEKKLKKRMTPEEFAEFEGHKTTKSE
jgi:hypothetical protein